MTALGPHRSAITFCWGSGRFVAQSDLAALFDQIKPRPFCSEESHLCVATFVAQLYEPKRHLRKIFAQPISHRLFLVEVELEEIQCLVKLPRFPDCQERVVGGYFIILEREVS